MQKQVAELDYAISFQVSNNKSFELAERVIDLAPDGFTQCFFTNSGSESVDQRLKIALGYHRARGEGNRTRLIGRERGYHGVNFGGMSVGGMVPNRKVFSANLIPGVDHIRATMNLEHTAFTAASPNGARISPTISSGLRTARRQQHCGRYRRTGRRVGRRAAAARRLPRAPARNL